MCAFFIGMELKEEGEEIDMGLLMSKAVIHDIEEVIVGDISNPTKYYSHALTDQIAELSQKSADKLLIEFDSYIDLMDIWIDAKIGKEGYIVALSDKLAVVYKMQQEILGFGNASVRFNMEKLPEALEQLKNDLAVSEIENTLIIHHMINEAIALCNQIK